MRALVFDSPRHMRVTEVERPSPGIGEVTVAVLAAGICGSEMHSFLGHSTYRRQGTIFGHELVVVNSRGGVDRRAVVDPLLTCGRCAQCRAGRSNVCSQRRLLGAEVPGGFAEEVAVAEDNLIDLPDDVPDEVGVMAEPLANAVHVARHLHSVAGRPLAIVGCGPIGLSCLAVALLSGAGPVAIFDPVDWRRGLALELASAIGAAEVFGYQDLGDAPSRFDLIVDAVGSTRTRTAVVEMAEPGGTAVFLGLHDQESQLPINLAIRKELSLVASFAYVRADFVAAVAILNRLHGALGGLISVRPLEEGDAAMNALADAPDRNFKVVLRPRPVGAGSPIDSTGIRKSRSEA